MKRIFYSKSIGGFFNEELHGQKTIMVPDPSWERPMKNIPDPSGATDNDGQPVLVVVKDHDAVHPRIEQDNAGCKIPKDAVEITEERWKFLLDQQNHGKVIAANAAGFPVLVDREVKAEDVIAHRNRLLNASDWMVIRSHEIGTKVPEEWANYRQALRDIPNQPDFPRVTWPKEPE